MNQTKRSILNTSIHLIAQYGYAYFTLGFLTQHMHISKGVVNYHFPKKDMVFDEIVHMYTDDIKACPTLNDFLDYVFHHLEFYRCVREIIQNCRDKEGKRIYDSETVHFFDNPYQQGVLDAGCMKFLDSKSNQPEEIKQEIRQMLIAIKGA